MGQPHLDFVKVREGVCTPTRDTEDSVGYDLRSPSNYLIQAGTSAVIPTGLAIKIPKGYSGRLATKSVQAWKFSLIALGGIIDPGYSEETYALLHVLGGKDYEIEKGKDFLQLIMDRNITPPVRQVSQLPPTTKKTKPYSKATKEPLKQPNKKGTEQLKTLKTTRGSNTAKPAPPSSNPSKLGPFGTTDSRSFQDHHDFPRETPLKS